MLLFQSTRPRGARPKRLAFKDGGENVSIHAPARGATRGLLQDAAIIAFQSTRPRGARRTSFNSAGIRLSFNPRAREGRDMFVFHGVSRRACFNPRAREGRDRLMLRQVKEERVSIHAPARGATCLYFTIDEFQIVSIHAPARGATWRGYDITFNDEFQSTRPRGARHADGCRIDRICSFNPRAREGRDHICPKKPMVARVSIHAPARGATVHPDLFGIRRDVSIHAPARGATFLNF